MFTGELRQARLVVMHIDRDHRRSRRPPLVELPTERVRDRIDPPDEDPGIVSSLFDDPFVNVDEHRIRALAHLTLRRVGARATTRPGTESLRRRTAHVIR